VAIPKLIHRAWFGPREMPNEYVQYGERWKELNPEWRVIEWGYDNRPPLINESLFVNCGTEWTPIAGAAKATSIIQVAQADLLGYELLYRYGGLYVNTDMEPLRPIPDEFTQMDVLLANEIDDWLISNAWMMSAPQHPLIRAVIDAIPGNIAVETRSIDWQTGPKLLTRIKQEQYPDTPVLPARFCNPWTDTPWGQPHPDSLCAHHWGHKHPDHLLWG
jgi:mannosyltransferase OCH1-like enzyme